MPDSNYVNAKLRELVKERAEKLCEYCLALSYFSFHPFAIDHIDPASEGGSSDFDNLALACQHCNGCKYNKTTGIDPINGEEVLLFNPRRHSWSEHFIWNADETVIIGLTPMGRATVATLKMNRVEAVNLRKALRAFGVHPPK